VHIVWLPLTFRHQFWFSMSMSNMPLLFELQNWLRCVIHIVKLHKNPKPTLLMVFRNLTNSKVQIFSFYLVIKIDKRRICYNTIIVAFQSDCVCKIVTSVYYSQHPATEWRYSAKGVWGYSSYTSGPLCCARSSYVRTFKKPESEKVFFKASTLPALRMTPSH